jgi:hypothetical protein
MKLGWLAWMEAASDRTGTGIYGSVMQIRSKIFRKLSAGSVRSRLAGLLALSVLAARAFAQTPPIQRMPDGKPSFVGYWDLPYTPNMAAKDGEAAIPYTDAGRAAFKNHDAKDDPTSLCLYPGMPRIMQSPYPIQIIQTQEYVTILFEYMRQFRAIPTDGRAHPENLPPSFMGDSTGKWEGDTLVVDTTGLNDRSWLDTAGHQHTDEMHLTERFVRTPTTINLEYTIDDPKMYAKPWKQERIIRPSKPAPHGLPQLIEYSCEENNRDVQHLITTKPAADR